MSTLEVIAQRRSIRRFRDTPVPRELIEQVLLAGTQAPSAKNRQPWRFFVVQGDKRAEMVAAMRQGIEKLKGYGVHPGSSENTARIMARAPVTILVYNPDREWKAPAEPIDMIMETMDTQSIGAAIQNMCLAAVELGLGTLWIGDTTYALEELNAWLGDGSQMVAALSLGYPDESPSARPRKSVSEVTTWL
ncbi:MAG: nitroreductase [Chloroflexi bacterium]|nr:nitroreductase [Chloroflexota bacterium]